MGKLKANAWSKPRGLSKTVKDTTFGQVLINLGSFENWSKLGAGEVLGHTAHFGLKLRWANEFQIWLFLFIMIS